MTRDTQPKFNGAHYIEIADIIACQPANTRLLLARPFIDRFSGTQHNFKRAVFINACNLKGE